MGDDKPTGEDGHSDSGSDESPWSFDPKGGFKRDLYKKDGPKGERAWGNRKPEPRAPNEPKKGPAREISFGPVFKAATGGEHVYSINTRENAQDKTFIQALRVKTTDTEILSGLINLTEAKGKLVVIKHGAEGSVWHGETDFIEVIEEWLFGKPQPTAPAPSAPAMSMLPMAARMGDLTSHGSPLLPGPGSTNVLIGGMPAWRGTLDLALCPFPGASPHGAGPAIQGEPTVLINGMPAARMGDVVIEPSGGPNVIVMGCPTVLIGAPAPPPPEAAGEAGAAKELPWVVFSAKGTGDIVRGERKLEAVADWDAKKAKGKAEFAAGGEIALFKAKLPLNVKVRIPYTGMYAGLGITAEASALSVGAEAGGGVALNKDGKMFRGDWGAKIGAGLVGAGAKFSIDIGP